MRSETAVAPIERPQRAPSLTRPSPAPPRARGFRVRLKALRARLKIPLMNLAATWAARRLDGEPHRVDDLRALAPQRILLIRTDRIGDLLCSTPVIAALHRRWPDAKLCLVGGPRNRAASMLLPYVARGPDFSRHPATWLRLAAWLPRQRFDLAVSLRSEVLSGALIAAASRAPVRMAVHRSPRTAPAFNLFLGEEDIHQTRRFWQAARRIDPVFPGELPKPIIELRSDAAGVGPNVLASLGVPAHAIKIGVAMPPRHDRRHRRRAWPHPVLRDAVARLVGHGFEVLLVPGNRREHAEALRIARAVPGTWLLPPMTLAETASVQGQLDAWIGTSSGLLHLATAVGTPTLMVGTAALLRAWGPLGPLHHHVCADHPADITAAQVVDALFRLMARVTADVAQNPQRPAA